MASLEQHKQDCLKFLGNDFEDVHRWLDACFAQLGPQHRCARHHRDGIKEVQELFGVDASYAARLHILRDCRHIPTRADYLTGRVDALGLKKNWSTAAYVRYGDRDFEDLVKEHLKPTGLVLWAFLRWEDVQGFLSTVTQYAQEDILGLEAAWRDARARLESSNLMLTSSTAFVDVRENKSTPSEVREYLEEILAKVKQSRDEANQAEISVGYVSIDTLTNPFVYIDYELLEDLKPELSGTSPIEIARFAFPDTVSMPITMVGEPTQKTITFVSRQKTMTVSNVRLRSVPEGTEVSYVVGGNASGIIVSEIGDRLVIRNGIHRAFLLAQFGMKEIPCVYIKENQAVPFVSAAYPTFSPTVLLQQRQPLLTDFLRPELCLQAPVRRTQKIIRINADETMIPVD